LVIRFVTVLTCCVASRADTSSTGTESSCSTVSSFSTVRRVSSRSGSIVSGIGHVHGVLRVRVVRVLLGLLSLVGEWFDVRGCHWTDTADIGHRWAQDVKGVSGRVTSRVECLFVEGMLPRPASPQAEEQEEGK